MIRITLADDKTGIDVAVIARAFGTSIDRLESSLRTGIITRWFERGAGDHDNRARLVFFSSESSRPVVIDENGGVQPSAKQSGRPATNRQTPRVNSARSDNMANDKPNKPTMTEAETVRRARLDALLDMALQGTFPASDPLAIIFDAPPPAARTRGNAP